MNIVVDPKDPKYLEALKKEEERRKKMEEKEEDDDEYSSKDQWSDVNLAFKFCLLTLQ